MSLHTLVAPAPALRTVHAALGSAAAVRGARTPLAIRAVGSTLRPELPLPVHVLSGLDAPTGPPRTTLTGWRFLLRGNGPAVGTAETVLTPDGYAFSHFGEGPYVASAENALRRAAALPGSYQPRLLSIPELYMLTLWLHADAGAPQDEAEPALTDSDLLVPLAPAPPGIAADRPHRVDELLPLLSHRLLPGPMLEAPAA